MRKAALALLLLTLSPIARAQETPASPVLMNLGPIDGESDQKQSIITIRYDSKPGFAKPQVEAHGTFLQVLLPNTIVLKPGLFTEANSPYIRKFAAFQIDENTAGVRLFVTKEAAHLLPAISTDILENRVVVMLDHAKAEKELLANFNGVPVAGGPSPEQIVKATEVKNDIPDPVQLMSKDKDAAAVTPQEISSTVTTLPRKASDKAKVEETAAEGKKEARWADSIESKLVIVTVFVAIMLMILLALKTWRRMAVKTIAPGALQDFSLKTLATHALGPKQKISVVQVGQEQFLLGISPDSINFLTSLRKEEAPRVQIDPQLFQKTIAPKAPVREKVLNDVRTNEKPVREKTVAEPGSSIRYGVGDQGIKNLKASPKEPESLDDVTRLIRKKLKDLPKV